MMDSHPRSIDIKLINQMRLFLFCFSWQVSGSFRLRNNVNDLWTSEAVRSEIGYTVHNNVILFFLGLIWLTIGISYATLLNIQPYLTDLYNMINSLNWLKLNWSVIILDYFSIKFYIENKLFILI